MKRSRSELLKDDGGSYHAVASQDDTVGQAPLAAPAAPESLPSSLAFLASTTEKKEDILTPHTLRLLKLTLEGTAEHAAEASVHLTNLAAQSTTTPTQLWDILGRLQEGLTSTTWKMRSQAADALQGVAAQLPPRDQIQFLAHNHHIDVVDDDEAERTSSSNQIPTSQKQRSSAVSSTRSYLTIQDLSGGALDQVLAHGRPLMATANDRYELLQENELNDLDRSAFGGNKNEDSRVVAGEEFVRRRIKLQRRILAERLGLAGIGDVLGEQSVLPQTITANDLLWTEQQHQSLKDELPEAKRQRHVKHVIREQQQRLKSDSASSIPDKDNAFSVRALLLMQMQEQERTNKKNASIIRGGPVLSSHRNPQQLLATELVYRMFDPAWHIRHGALLGTLSLLRAWKTHHQALVDTTSPTSLFGIWPRDILARCVCILGLDRFGDFSGALVSSSSSSSTLKVFSSSTTGGVVAPVREVTGQLISMLFVMAPRNEQLATLDLLFHLCDYETEWEPRHGAFATLKFLLVVLRRTAPATNSRLSDILQKDGDNCTSWAREVAERMAHVAIRHLCDSSDDVASAAAQVVTEYLRSLSANIIPTFVLKASPDLMIAVRTARSVSSSMIDLVELLAVMLRIDARSFVASLSLTNDFASNILDLSEVLLSLLESDYPSVRTSALHSVSAFLDLLRPSDNDPNGALSPEAARVCTRLVETLFEWYFFVRDSDGSDDEKSPDKEDNDAMYVLRDSVWKDLTILAGRFGESIREEMGKFEMKLIQRYFWIDQDSLLFHAEYTPFFSEASAALSAFLLAGNKTPSGRSLVAMASLLNSPWLYHCEASCLLFKSICSQLDTIKGVECVRDPLISLLVEPPLCLLVKQANIAEGGPQDKSFHDLCKRVFCSELSSYVDTTEAPGVAVKRIISAWTTMLQARGLPRPESFTKLPYAATMRVEAAIAGAVVASGLPAKITPVVRGLMTSLNNEAASRARQAHICLDLSQLLKQLGAQPNYAAAQRKVISKICDLAIGERAESDQSNVSSGLAANVLHLLCGDISSLDGLKEIQPLWSRISSLCLWKRDDAGLIGSAKLLRILTGSFNKGNLLVSYIIDTFTECLVSCFCEAEHILKRESSATLSTLCALDPDKLFESALPVLIELLQQQTDDSLRLSACFLLKDLVDVSTTAISRFVRVLLPVVMSLMTDRSEECSMNANSLFATLVRVAPLAQRDSSSSLKHSVFESKSDNVIDHLIFGLPLPPYSLPRNIDDALKAAGIELRSYQTEGIAWLRFLQTVKLNGALCDSMGLGKTIQALVAVAIAHDDFNSMENKDGRMAKPVSLVVCPASVVGHWVHEIKKFFPAQRIFQALCYAGPSASRKLLRSTFASEFNVVVTSYSVLRSDIEFLAGCDWQCCVLDEGHLLKNPRTATARASKRIRALHKTILSGTPVQNKVSEVWAIFDFLMPNFLGSSNSFSKEYARPIMKSHQPNASATSVKEGMTKLKLLHQQVLPFILRREKEQVLGELPPKNIITVHVPLSDLQERVYRNFCSTSEAKKSLAALEGTLGDALVSGENMSSDVLKSILFLRLLCTHPSMVHTKTSTPTAQNDCSSCMNESGKLVALAELLVEAGIYNDTIMAADNDSSLVYCDENVSPPDAYNEVISFQSNSSLRQDAVSALSRSRCLIFAQFTATLDIVEELVFKQKMPALRYMRLDGRVPMEKRAEMAEAFNEDPSVSVMLLTTRVGGLGLNLTGADMVIFVESDFNPFVDLQAMDRAHRIGQNRTVNVYRIIMEDTIEEKILELQERKMAVSSAIVNSENSTMYQMGTERLLDIFSFKGSQEANDKEGQGDYDLDALMERFADDYSSLSVHEFAKTL